MPRVAKLGEPINTAYTMRFTESQMDNLREYSAETGLDISVIIRQAVADAIEGRQALKVLTELPSTIALNVIAAVPCGPLETAVSDPSSIFRINDDVRNELEAQEDDFFVRANGQSMEGAGIADGGLVLMRPLLNHKQPRNGDIAMVQITDSEANVTGTIKRWRMRAGKPFLEDGEGEEVVLPDNVTEMKAVAVARGVIAAL